MSQQHLLCHLFINLVFTVMLCHSMCPQGCSCSIDDSHIVYCNDITLTDLPALLDPRTKSLSLIKCKIQKLDPDILELYPDLELLDLSGNEIETLQSGHFRFQTNLKVLKLGKNKISSMRRGAFIGLGNLKVLDLSENRLHNIDKDSFQELQSLELLNLSYNTLSDISADVLDGLSSLQMLNMSRNRLQSFDIGSLRSVPQLQSLDLSHNLISEMKISEISTIQHNALLHLNLSSNLLSAIDDATFATVTQLRQLNLDNNMIRSISMLGLRQLFTLEELDLSWNSIEMIGTSSFDGLTNLKKLYLRHLHDLHLIELNAFSGLNSLQIIDLSSCYSLKSIDESAFETSDRLELLDLSFCNLQHLPAQLVNWFRLKTLRLNGNPLHCDSELLSFLPPVLRHFHLNIACASPLGLSHQNIAFLEPQKMPESRIGLLFCVVGLLSLLTLLILIGYCFYDKKTRAHQKLVVPTYTPSSLANSTIYDKGELLSKQIFYSPSEFSASTVSTSDEGEHYSSPIYPTENEQIYETPHQIQRFVGSYPPKVALANGIESVLSFDGSCRALPYTYVVVER